MIPAAIVRQARTKHRRKLAADAETQKRQQWRIHKTLADDDSFLRAVVNDGSRSYDLRDPDPDGAWPTKYPK